MASSLIRGFWISSVSSRISPIRFCRWATLTRSFHSLYSRQNPRASGVRSVLRSGSTKPSSRLKMGLWTVSCSEVQVSSDDARDGGPVLFQESRVGDSFGRNVIGDRADVEHIERHIAAPGLDVDDAALAQGMADAQLIEDVGVVDAQVGDAQVCQEQLLEHIGQDVAAGGFLVGPEGFKPGRSRAPA